MLIHTDCVLSVLCSRSGLTCRPALPLIGRPVGWQGLPTDGCSFCQMAGLGLRDVCPAESPASAKCALRYTLRASLGLREVRLEALPASAMFALTGRNTVHASHGLHCRGVNRISARQGKHRRSQEGIVLVQEKCTRFVANWFTFPKRTGKECCQNRCSADFLRGSVPEYGRNGSLPLKKPKHVRREPYFCP